MMKLHTCPHCGKECFYYENQPNHRCLRCRQAHSALVEPEERKERDLEAEAITIAAEMCITRGWLYKGMRVEPAWYCVIGEFFPAGVTVGIWDYKSWEQAKEQLFTTINMAYNKPTTDLAYRDVAKGEAA